jgi:hypothetical protein
MNLQNNQFWKARCRRAQETELIWQNRRILEALKACKWQRNIFEESQRTLATEDETSIGFPYQVEEDGEELCLLSVLTGEEKIEVFCDVGTIFYVLKIWL